MTTVFHDAHTYQEDLTQSKQNTPFAQIDQAIYDTYFSDEGIVTLSAADKITLPTLSLSKADRGNRNVVVAANSGTDDQLIEVLGTSVGDVIALRADTGDTIRVQHNSGSATNKIYTLTGSEALLSETNPTLFLQVATNVLAQITQAVTAGALCILTDEKATTTHGGNSAAATWNARDINTEVYDPYNLVALSSNQITPISGTYKVSCTSIVYDVGYHKLRLYNVTGTSSVKTGLNAYSNATYQSGSTAHLECTVTANGTDAFRFDHYTQGATTNGLGQAVSDGGAEIYLISVWEKL